MHSVHCCKQQVSGLLAYRALLCAVSKGTSLLCSCKGCALEVGSKNMQPVANAVQAARGAYASGAEARLPTGGLKVRA